jgi:hypothetical protein
VSVKLIKERVNTEMTATRLLARYQHNGRSWLAQYAAMFGMRLLWHLFQQMTLLLLLVATAAQAAVTRTVCDSGIVNDSGMTGGGENAVVEGRLTRRGC